MTEKRFEIVDEQFISYYGGTGHLISNGECKFWLWHNKEESQKVCDKLNELHEEKEEMQKKMNRLYNYFADFFSEEMGNNDFTEQWEFVADDEKWD